MSKLFYCEECSVQKKNACPMPIEAVRNMQYFQSCPMRDFHEKYCYECVGDLHAAALLKFRASRGTAFCAGKDNKDLDGIDFVHKCIFEETEGVRAMIVKSHEMEFAPKLTKFYKLRNIAGRIFEQNNILMLAEIMQRIRG